MVKDRDYLKLFSKDGEDALTEKELSEIIEEELSKPEKKMDAELIESCLDEINRLKKSEAKGEDSDGVKINNDVGTIVKAGALSAYALIDDCNNTNNQAKWPSCARTTLKNAAKYSAEVLYKFSRYQGEPFVAN